MAEGTGASPSVWLLLIVIWLTAITSYTYYSSHDEDKLERSQQAAATLSAQDRLTIAMLDRKLVGVDDKKRRWDSSTETAPQCTNYTLLTESWRRPFHEFGDAARNHCDEDNASNNSFKEGWNRFAPSIGGSMLVQTRNQQSVSLQCGNALAGYLNGSHPSEPGQMVIRPVCFTADCSHYNMVSPQLHVTVYNCGSFFVYNLPSLRHVSGNVYPLPRNGTFCNLVYGSMYLH